MVVAQDAALPCASRPSQALGRLSQQQPASLPHMANGGPQQRQTRQQGGGGLFGRLCGCAGAGGHHDEEDAGEPQELAPAPQPAANPSPFASPSQQPAWVRSASARTPTTVLQAAG